MTLRKTLPAAMIALVFAVPVATWWLVDPKDNARVTLLPVIGPRSAGVQVSARW